MHPHISLITLGVTDLKRSTDFYKALGFETDGDNQGITFFKLRGTWLSLFPKEELAKDAQTTVGEIAPTFTLAHNVKSKEEVNSAIEHAAQLGHIYKKNLKTCFGEAILHISKTPTGICGR